MATQFITDEQGKKVSVLVPIKQYEKMINALEEAADERAYDRAMRRKEPAIPAMQAF